MMGYWSFRNRFKSGLQESPAHRQVRARCSGSHSAQRRIDEDGFAAYLAICSALIFALLVTRAHFTTSVWNIGIKRWQGLNRA
jgi:hypothetical protein